MDLTKEINKGLALAAGGARGAYQAGALLALAEAGHSYKAVAGTSVGVLNGAFYVQGEGTVKDIKKLCSLWREIGSIGIVGYKPGFLQEIISLKIFRNGGHILDPQPLMDMLDKHLDYEKITRAGKEFIITTIPSIDPVTDILAGSYQQPHYYHAQRLKAGMLRKAVMAAIAIPIAFPSISLDGMYFTDAGLSTPLPSKILYDKGFHHITSIFLSDSIIQNRLDYPGAVIFQIRPSVNISPSLMSMLDFSPVTIENLLQSGYADTKKYITEIAVIKKQVGELQQNKDKLDNLMDQLPH